MSAPPLGVRVVRWPRRFWPRALGEQPPATPPDPLRLAGQLLHDSRVAKGLRLRDLALRTRISLAVLEALEGGWRDRLPEATYLRTMLPLLEHELDLPPGSLEAVLPEGSRVERGQASQQSLAAAVFSPFTIHFLTRWQGTVLYGLLTLGLLYALNLQQQRLALLGRLATNPIPLAAMGPAEPGAPAGRQASGAPEAQPPLGAGLQPLSRAAAGQALALLARENQQGGEDWSLGPLRLTLEQPTRVDLRSPQGGDWRVERLQGEVSLPVLPPFELRLSPAPSPAAVTWRGQPLLPSPPSAAAKAEVSNAASGVYRVPAGVGLEPDTSTPPP